MLIFKLKNVLKKRSKIIGDYSALPCSEKLRLHLQAYLEGLQSTHAKL